MSFDRERRPQPESKMTSRSQHHDHAPTAEERTPAINYDRLFASALRHGSSAPTIGLKGQLADETIEARSIVSGLRAAQHAIDGTFDASNMEAQAAIARRHLAHVQEVGEKYGWTVHEKDVEDAASSLNRAVYRFIARAPATGLPPDVQLLFESNLMVRGALGLDASSTTADQRERGSDASYVRNALPPALHVIATRSEAALARLDTRQGTEDRNAIVSEVSNDIDGSIEYARWLLAQLPHAEHGAFTADAELAATRMHKLLRWIRTRTAHRGMEERFLKSVRSFENVLRSVGAPIIAGRDAPALSENGQATSDREAAALTAAANSLGHTLESVEVRQREAVVRFATLAGLADNEQPSFVQAIIQAVFVAAVGHLGGALAATLLKVAGSAMGSGIARALTNEQVVQRVVDVSTDSLQSIVGQALTEAASTDPQTRARAFFVTGMQVALADRISAYKTNVGTLIERSEVSPAQLDGMRTSFELQMDSIDRTCYVHTVKAWTSYVAQSKLGSTKPHGKSHTVSKMGDYFGTPTAGGREFGTSHQGTLGAFQIHMRVDPPGTKPKVEHESTNVIGMNSEMKTTIVKEAGHNLDRVWLPKEVHVRTDYGHAIIALDENNVVRDVLNWEQVAQKVGISSGYQFWKLWGKNVQVS